MAKRLVLIDGKSVFYRGYYAMPNLSTKDGTPTGGVYGFAVLALEVVKRLEPDYVAVAWDKSKTNIRARLAMYPQYKANRKAPPPDFYEQIPLLRELLDSLGWPLYEADDLEADDLMGIFAKQAGKKGIESYLVTSDLDVLQLVNTHTHIFTLKKGLTNIELFNEASFKEKYGVDATQWVDVKALKGDSSDNIPGVAGIGEKTALELISTYSSLDGVYENVELLKPKLRDKLLAGKTGYSTGAAELDKLRPLHPIINLITEYREYTKLKSTYIDALPKLVDAKGKLHTTFALDVAATGRLSSHDPNLQNIPTRTELGQAIRTAFVPAQGNVFVSADYSQFELRLAAVMANDQQMIDDFNKDIDIHTATAAQVYGVPLEKVTKDMRRHAKTVNFGILYGMSPHGLSVATGMNLLEAKQFIDKYFELRKPIKEYMEHTAKEGLEKGYVHTIFGRRRPTPDLKSSNFMVREGAKRAAINMPIQGTEADLMKIAMLEVEKQLDGLGEQILQIHDSILVETPEANAEKVAKLLKDTMENIYKLPVKLKVDVTTGRNWGEL